MEEEETEPEITEEEKETVEEPETENVEEETVGEKETIEEETEEEKKVDSFNREMHKAVCADCGKECEVPFKPTEGRPIYCRDCYRKHGPQRRQRRRF